MSEASGLESRYHVEKIHDPDGKHDACRYFVLDPQHDPLARIALSQYARAAHYKGYAVLADDLFAWLRETEAAHSLESATARGGAADE